MSEMERMVVQQGDKLAFALVLQAWRQSKVDWSMRGETVARLIHKLAEKAEQLAETPVAGSNPSERRRSLAVEDTLTKEHV